MDLNRKLHMYHPRYLANAYNDAMSNGQTYNYILLDTTVFCDHKSSVRTGLFPDESSYIYRPIEY